MCCVVLCCAVCVCVCVCVTEDTVSFALTNSWRQVGTGVAMIINALDTKAKTNTPCAGANDNVAEEELEMLEM